MTYCMTRRPEPKLDAKLGPTRVKPRFVRGEHAPLARGPQFDIIPENAASERSAAHHAEQAARDPSLASPAAAAELDALYTAPSNGLPLSPRLRRSFEHALAAPLGSVKIFSNSASRAFSQRINADAFTVGRSVFLGRTKPGERAETLAHELAHTTEPSHLPSAKPQIHRKVTISGTPLEADNGANKTEGTGTAEGVSVYTEIVNAASATADLHRKRLGEQAGDFDKRLAAGEEARRVLVKEVLSAMIKSPKTFAYADNFPLILELRTRVGAIQAMEQTATSGCCGYGDDFNLSNKWQAAHPIAPPRNNSRIVDFGVGDALPGSDLPAPRPSEAVDSIFQGTPTPEGHISRLDCNSMVVSAQWKGIRDALGAAGFDLLIERDKVVIRPLFEGDDILLPHTDAMGTPQVDLQGRPIMLVIRKSTLIQFFELVEVDVTPGDETADLIPGDWVYFKNADAYSACTESKPEPQRLYRGEHALYIGGGKFNGLGPGAVNYDGMMNMLTTETENMCAAAAAAGEPSLACTGNSCDSIGLASPGGRGGAGKAMVYRLNAFKLQMYLLAQLRALFERGKQFPGLGAPFPQSGQSPG